MEWNLCELLYYNTSAWLYEQVLIIVQNCATDRSHNFREKFTREAYPYLPIQVIKSTLK